MTLDDFKPFTFPGGERHFQVDPEMVFSGGVSTLKAHLRTAQDIMDLMLVAEFVHRHGFHPTLLMPYVPYARQDRPTTSGSPFALKAFCDLVNGLGFDGVHIYEPHSAVTPALLNGCQVHSMTDASRLFVADVKRDVGGDVLLCAPDASAAKRVEAIDSEPYVQALKRRDPATGRVTLADIIGPVSGNHLVMIDDICDGGATFTELSRQLVERGAKSVHLFVAHGIFSKGFEPLTNAGISTIGTTDSFCRRDNLPSFVSVYESL